MNGGRVYDRLPIPLERTNLRARTWHDVIERARSFIPDLEARKHTLDSGLSWYPYTTLSQLTTAGNLLNTVGESFEKLAGDAPVLDVGCGDGDLSFLLAHCGYRVSAIDHPRAHQNGMAGVRKLQEHFGGAVEVIEKDLDRPFEGPQPAGGFAFLLGVLYHLENPLQVLRWLARHADYCLLSTRVARSSPGGQMLEPAAVAYLTDEAELNNDNSNFWIFTPSGLRRLLRRAGWSLLAMELHGAEDSRPAEGVQHDERAYCLAKTTRALRNIEAAYGWTEDEGDEWRWTMPRFGAWIRPPRGVSEARLSARIFLPAEQLEQLGTFTLEATAGGRMLGAQSFTSPGEWVYQAQVEGLAGDGAPVFVEFSIGKPFRPPAPDDRDLGVVVCGLDLS